MVQEDPNRPRIVRPDLEIEVPDFIALADEILQAEIDERNRILNMTPVVYMNARQALRKEKQAKKRQ